MIASLPMYWTARNAAVWCTFWQYVIRAAHDMGQELPPLAPPEALPASWYDHWRDPDLVLSQTCGLPWRAALRDQVQYVGTFDFAIADCPPGFYHSVVIRRPEDQNGWRLAYNAPDSQSGWAAAWEYLETRKNTSGQAEWTSTLKTGSHTASAKAVADGRADIAFLDAVTWRLLSQNPDLSEKLTVMATTRPTPALPLITSRNRDPAPLRAALSQGIRNLTVAEREAMGGLSDLVVLDQAQYFAEPLPPNC